MWIISAFGLFLLILNELSPAAADVSHLTPNGINNQFFDHISLLRNAIRGEPNIDYPIYSHPPATSFTCAGRHDGYYADTETRCQVFRVCANTDTTGHGFAFLCPNGTLFNQRHFVCDWHYNVNCNESPSFYFKNDQLGKRIESHDQMMTMVRYMQNFVNQPSSLSSQSGSASTVLQSSGGSSGSANFGATLGTSAGGVSFGQGFGDSSSSATNYGSHQAHQKIYVSNLGELSTEPGSGFDLSKSNIINPNPEFQQSGTSSTTKGGSFNSDGHSKLSSQPFHGKFNAVFSGSGNLIGLGSHLQPGGTKYSGSDIKSNAIYLPPRPPVHNTYIPPHTPVQNTYIPPQAPPAASLRPSTPPKITTVSNSGSTQAFPSFPGNLTLDQTDYGLFPEDNLEKLHEGHSVRNRDVSNQENLVRTDHLSSLNGTLALRVPAPDLLPPFLDSRIPIISEPFLRPDIPQLATDLLPPFEESPKTTITDQSTPLSIFVLDETTTTTEIPTTTPDLPKTTIEIEESAKDAFEPTNNTEIEATTESGIELARDLLPPFESNDNVTDASLTTRSEVETTTEPQRKIIELARDLLPPFGTINSIFSEANKTNEDVKEETTITPQVVVAEEPFGDLLPPFEKINLRFSEVNTTKNEDVKGNDTVKELFSDLLPPLEQTSDASIKISTEPVVETTTEEFQEVFTTNTPDLPEVDVPFGDLLPPLEGKINFQIIEESSTQENLQELSTESETTVNQSNAPTSTSLETSRTESITEVTTVATEYPDEETTLALNDDTTVTESLEENDLTGNAIDQVGLSSKNDIPQLILELLPPLRDEQSRRFEIIPEETTTFVPTTIADDAIQAKEINDELVDFDVLMAQMGGFFINDNSSQSTQSQEIPTTETIALTSEEQTTSSPTTTTTTASSTTPTVTLTSRRLYRTRTTTQFLPRGFQTLTTGTFMNMTTTLPPRDIQDYARRLRNRMRQFQYVSQHSPAFTTPTIPVGFTRAPSARARVLRAKTTTRRHTTTTPQTTTTTTMQILEASQETSPKISTTSTPTHPTVITKRHTTSTPQTTTTTTSTTREISEIPQETSTTKTTSDPQVTAPPRVSVPTQPPAPPATTTTTVITPRPPVQQQTPDPKLDIRFGDDDDDNSGHSAKLSDAPSKYFSLPLSPVEIKERELRKLGLIPRAQNVQDSEKEGSAFFPQRIQFPTRFDSSALPLTTGYSTSTSHVLPSTSRAVYQPTLYQTPQATSFSNRFSSHGNERATDIQIIPARGYYFNDPHERKLYYDDVARGLFNDHGNGYVYIKPRFSTLQEVPQYSQRVPTVAKQHEIQHSGVQASPLKVLEARDTEGSIFRGFDSYAAPLSHVGQLPTDTVYNPAQSHSQSSFQPF